MKKTIQKVQAVDTLDSIPQLEEEKKSAKEQYLDSLYSDLSHRSDDPKKGINRVTLLEVRKIQKNSFLICQD